MDLISESYQNLAENIYPRLVEVITRRYQQNSDRTMQDVYRMDPAFTRLDAENLEFTLTFRKEIVEILEYAALLESLLDLFVLSTLDFTYDHHQYLRLNTAEKDEMKRIYRAYLRAMKLALQVQADEPREKIRTRLEAVIQVHFGNLRDNLTHFLDCARAGSTAPDCVNTDLDGNAIFTRVVCEQYSPEFQLNILGMRLDEIRTPVLDLGCGKAGTLVKYLNAHGVMTYGVDRTVEASQWLTASDWLEYPIEANRWGTIVSHMAFSNHFVFQHLYKNGHPEPYARKYMAILAGLKMGPAGGSFYYAPGLPFMEGLLPAELYKIKRRSVMDMAEIDQTLYAAQVSRR